MELETLYGEFNSFSSSSMNDKISKINFIPDGIYSVPLDDFTAFWPKDDHTFDIKNFLLGSGPYKLAYVNQLDGWSR